MRGRSRLVAGLTGLCVAIAACGAGGEPARSATLLPSDRLELPTFDFADFQALLQELRGTPVVVNIWASWCGPCREEGPHLADMARRYDGRVQFIGVDILDNRESARAFIREFGWPYPSVFDPTGAIRDRLGFIGQPVTAFYDTEARLVDSWIGPIPRRELIEGIERIL